MIYTCPRETFKQKALKSFSISYCSKQKAVSLNLIQSKKYTKLNMWTFIRPTSYVQIKNFFIIVLKYMVAFFMINVNSNEIKKSLLLQLKYFYFNYNIKNLLKLVIKQKPVSKFVFAKTRDLYINNFSFDLLVYFIYNATLKFKFKLMLK